MREKILPKKKEEISKKVKPTIAELEEILDKPKFQLNPDGSIKVVTEDDIRNQAISDCLASLPKGLDEEKVADFLITYDKKNLPLVPMQRNWYLKEAKALCEAYKRSELFPNAVDKESQND